MQGYLRKILGVKVNFGLKMTDVVKIIDEAVQGNHKGIVCTTNAEFIITAQKDTAFKNIINDAFLSIPDGVGVLFANYYMSVCAKLKASLCQRSGMIGVVGKLLYPIVIFVYGVWFGISTLFVKYALGERLSGADLFYQLFELSDKKGYSIFLLGGNPRNFLGKDIQSHLDTATLASQNMKKDYKGVRVIGSTSKFSADTADDAATLAYINSYLANYQEETAQINILFVAYGHPKQEKWIQRNLAQLPVNVCVGVGGTFDYVIKTQRRSPEFFISHNLEWLYRLFTQPWRLSRIFSAFPTFPLKIFLNCL